MPVFPCNSSTPLTISPAGSLFAGPLPEIGQVCRDPNDDHVIATALAVSVGFIVTGDKDLLALGHYETIRIVTARAFLTELARDANAG